MISFLLVTAPIATLTFIIGYAWGYVDCKLKSSPPPDDLQ